MMWWEKFLALLGSMRSYGPPKRVLETTTQQPELARTWEAIAEETAAVPQEERLFDVTERLFGEERARVILWRDAAGWCPFCFATVLLLEEMRLSYETKTIPLAGYMRPGETKDPEYLKMVPDGVVPGLQHRHGDGFEPAFRNVYRIFDDLRRTYPEKYPLGDEATHDAIVGVDACAGRLASGVPYRRDPEAAREVLDALNGLVDEKGPFVCGASLTAADCMLLPFLERLEAYTVYFHGRAVLAKLPWEPKLARLLRAARSRCDAYKHFGSDAHTLARIALRVSPGTPISPDAIEVDRPDRSAITNADSRTAAKKLAKNHAAVAKFAARIANKHDDVTLAVDDALLAVAHGLLRPPPLSSSSSFSSDDDFDEGGGGESLTRKAFDYSSYATTTTTSVDGVADALQALSLNVGVPRDFTLGPANAIRAHLADLAAALRRAPPPPPVASSSPEEEVEVVDATAVAG